MNKLHLERFHPRYLKENFWLTKCQFNVTFSFPNLMEKFNSLCSQTSLLKHWWCSKSEPKESRNSWLLLFYNLSVLALRDFNFPLLTYLPVQQLEIYLLFRRAVYMLILFNFKGMFVSSDGAQSNRNFMHTLLPDFSVTNPTISSVKNI